MVEKPHDWHNLLERDPAYGRIVQRAVAVGVTSVSVIDQNRQRKKVLFINDSDTPIYLAKGGVAVLNVGTRLNANGGSWEETPDLLGYMWVGQFSAITSAAAKNLLVIEEM